MGLIGQSMGQGGESRTSSHVFKPDSLRRYLYSLAGDLAAKRLGHRSMTAPDIISNISDAFQEIQNVKESPFTVESRARLR